MKNTEEFVDTVCSFLSLNKEEFLKNLQKLRSKNWIRWPGGGVEIPVAEMLYCITYMKAPQIIVELGTNYGYSAIHLAAALKDSIDDERNFPNWDYGCQFLTTDIDRDAQLAAENHFYDKDLESTDLCQFNFHLEDSVEFSKKIVQAFSPEIVFIDSSHEYNHTWQEWKALLPGLNESSIVMFHDATTPDYGVSKFLDELAAQGEWKVLKLETQPNTGFGIVIKNV